MELWHGLGVVLLDLGTQGISPGSRVAGGGRQTAAGELASRANDDKPAPRSAATAWLARRIRGRAGLHGRKRQRQCDRQDKVRTRNSCGLGVRRLDLMGYLASALN